MQEEVENRSVTLAINTAKLTGRTLKNAILKFLEAQKNKSRDSPDPIPHGKQTVKQLAEQNQGMDTLARICETLNCEITDVIELVPDEPASTGGKEHERIETKNKRKRN